jgi:beta-galactosidase
MKKILLFFSALTIWTSAIAQIHNFAIGDKDFMLDGKPFVIRSGELHPTRIPREYWQHRLQMLKAMGLNTVTIYLFWNTIEPKPNQFYWKEMADAASFCKLAQKEGLWVILRPGPYVCAEWDMGGFPWWLLKKEDIKFRTQDSYFLERSRKYLLEVGRELAPLQVTKGGPIIMTQVENEYGHYASDTVYLGKIRDYIVEAGFNVPLYHCDYFTHYNDIRKDIFTTVNFGTSENPKEAIDSLRKHQPKGPVLVSEFYPGWLDHWGEKHGTVYTNPIVKSLTYFLQRNYSFNFYMLHGGTSFGMWSGANCSDEYPNKYNPQTSSYDYDAPISEAGWETPKYLELRKTISQYFDSTEKLPAIPRRIPTMTIKKFKTTEFALVLNNLPEPIKDLRPKNMEAYNQGFGYIVYSTTLNKGEADSLKFKEIHDYALIFIDGKKIATLDRRKQKYSCVLPKREKPVKLEIIVDVMGRINSESFIHDRKGIIGNVLLKNIMGDISELINWNIYPFALNNENAPSKLKYQIGTTLMPAFHKATIKLNEIKDCFLDMSTWGKGLVWVNGHCLGRYWNIGPTQTMYLPGVWLKKGANEIVVLDFIGASENILGGQELPILNSLKNEN